MTSPRRAPLVCAVVVAAFVPLFASSLPDHPHVRGGGAGGAEWADSPLDKLPMVFEPNAGQAPPSALFVSRFRGASLQFRATEVELSLAVAAPAAASPPEQRAGRSIVSLKLVDAEPSTAVVPAAPLPGKVNYLIGDPTRWRTNLPTYGGLNYSGVYPGIDLTFEGGRADLKGTYTVAAGADPARIRWRYGGAREVRLDESGDLRIRLNRPVGLRAGSGEDADDPVLLSERAPVAWQEAGGRRRPVPVRYQLDADGTIGFDLGTYDRARALTIDPTIEYVTYLGGSGGSGPTGTAKNPPLCPGAPLPSPCGSVGFLPLIEGDGAVDIAADGSGHAYVTGVTDSVDFPTKSAYQNENTGTSAYESFVTKLDPSRPGAEGLVYSTYLGGLGDDLAHGIAVDDDGNAYVSGATTSDNFLGDTAPVLRVDDFQAFVVKLHADGAGVGYARKMGGDIGSGIAVDDEKNAYVVGWDGHPTNPGPPGRHNPSVEPSAGAFQPSYGGRTDGFLTKLNADGGLLYSTFIGGSEGDYAEKVAVDGGRAHVTGWTQSSSATFPVRRAFQAADQDGVETFFSVVDTTLSGDASLSYSTFIGGADDDFGSDVAVDAGGHAYVAGYTFSSDDPSSSEEEGFPTTDGAYQRENAGGPPQRPDYRSEGFLAKFDASRSGEESLVYSTYVGRFNQDLVLGVAVDIQNNVFVVGVHVEIDEDQPGAPAPSAVFITKVNNSGSARLYEQELKGSDVDLATAVALDGAGGVFVAGQTASPDFPATPNSYQPVYRGPPGYSDAFVAKICDACPSLLGVSSETFPEGNTEAPRAFRVTLQSGSRMPAALTYSTKDSTAKAGEDYRATSGPLLLTPGGEATISISILGDPVREPDEQFLVEVADAATGVTLTGMATILNDDAAASLPVPGPGGDSPLEPLPTTDDPPGQPPGSGAPPQQGAITDVVPPGGSGSSAVAPKAGPAPGNTSAPVPGNAGAPSVNPGPGEAAVVNPTPNPVAYAGAVPAPTPGAVPGQIGVGEGQPIPNALLGHESDSGADAAAGYSMVRHRGSDDSTGLAFAGAGAGLLLACLITAPLAFRTGPRPVVASSRNHGGGRTRERP